MRRANVIMGKPRVGWLVVTLALFLPGCAQSDDRSVASAELDGLRGRIERVFDGDSFVLRSDGRKVDVRVFGVDAPEKGQPFSKKARSRSKELLEGEEVVVLVTTPSDRYGRVVGNVILSDGRNYAHIIVGEGLAWQYRRYSKDLQVAALEREARSERRGLWRDKDPEPPWEYRRRKPRR